MKKIHIVALAVLLGALHCEALTLFPNRQLRQLRNAASRGDLKEAKAALANNADVNAEGFWGDTPMSLAIKGGHKDMVRLLLDNGADVRYLSWAAAEGHTDIVRLLLDKGADVNFGHQGSPLSWAAFKGHTDIVRLLLDKGADVEGKRDFNTSPLILAAEGGHKDIVRLLLDNGADINVKNRRGEPFLGLSKTAFEVAKTNEIREMIRKEPIRRKEEKIRRKEEELKKTKIEIQEMIREELKKTKAD